MVKDAKAFTKNCDRCQQYAAVPGFKSEKLHFLTSPWPFAQWGIDLIGPLPKCKGQFKYAVVAVDYFTKWVEAEPLATITERKITNFVWKNIVCRFGVPNTIISDNGRQFDNKNFSRFCDDLGIKHAKSSPAHPQANGQVEAVNKIIKLIMKTKIVGKKGVWAQELPSILWAYRTTARTATGETPYSLTFGTEAVLPIELNIPSPRVEDYNITTNDDGLRANLDLIEESREIAHMRNLEQKRKIAKYYNSRVKERGFKVGSLVLRRVMPNTKETGAGVLGVNWEGPYAVQATSGSGAYWLADLSGQPIPRPWNIEHLRPYHT